MRLSSPTGLKAAALFMRNPRWVALVLMLVATMAPHILLWSNTHIPIHDHLDADAALAKVLADDHYLFAPNSVVVAPVMGGISRQDLGSEFNPYNLLFLAFPPLVALIINEVLMRTIALIGMALLLSDHILADHPKKALIACLVAAAFATLNFWSPGGTVVAGVPMLAWAYLNLRNGKFSWNEAGAAVLFALYGNPVYIAPFVLLVLACFTIWDLLHGAYWKVLFTTGFSALLLLVYAVVDWRLIASLLSGSASASQRIEMVSPWFNTAGVPFGIFFASIFIARSGQSHIILPLTILMLATWGLVWTRVLKADCVQITDLGRRMVAWMAAAAFIGAICALWYTDSIQQQWHSLGLPFFDWSRFENLLFTAWFVIFALALAMMETAGRQWRTITIPMVTAIALLQSVNDLAHTAQYADWIKGLPGFRSFYSEALFSSIRNDIGRDRATYRVGSIGIFPSIALWNGFYTIDGLLPYYPLDYKKRFRAVIAGELAKDSTWRNYYDHSGARVFLFSTALSRCDFLCTKKRAPASINLDIDTDAFRRLGGRYLLSVSQIRNARALRLTFVKEYDSRESPWRIFLYRAEAERGG